jgi:hypothetical protein
MLGDACTSMNFSHCARSRDQIEAAAACDFWRGVESLSGRGIACDAVQVIALPTALALACVLLMRDVAAGAAGYVGCSAHE